MRNFEEYVIGGQVKAVYETYFDVGMSVGQTLEEELNILDEYLTPFLSNS